MSLPDEPEIIINGEMLTQPQAMALRVALGIFQIELGSEDLDSLATKDPVLAKGYRDRLREVAILMQKGR